MAITTSCPGCKSLFRLANELAGHEVRCQKCERLFTVPMLMTLATPSEPSAAAEPASPPAPPAPLAAPPPAMKSEPAPVPAPPRAAETPKPAEEVVQATMAEPAPAPKPPPPPPERAVSLAWSLAALALFLIGALTAGGLAASWVYTHLGPTTRVTYVAPPAPIIRHPLARINNDILPPRDFGVKDAGFDFKMDKGIGIKNGARPVPTPIFAPDGRGARDGRLENPAPGIDHGRFGKAGAYALYRVTLVQGRIYNFFINTNNEFEPKLQIFDGEIEVARRLDVFSKRLMLTCKAKRSGEHLVFVTSQQRQPGNFFLSMAPENRLVPVLVNLTQNPSFFDNSSLRVEDPLDAQPLVADDGPFREYDLVLAADQEYTFTLTNAGFAPVLLLWENGQWKERFPEGGGKDINVKYTAKITGKLRVRVTSDQFGLGAYSFTAVRKVDRPQRIIGQLNDAGRYEDQRNLAASDPLEPAFVGRGPHKIYLLRLEKGLTYEIELTSKDYDTYLGVYDPADRQIAVNVSKLDARLARVTIQATETGTYRIHAAATRPKMQGPYTLTVVQK